MNLDSLISAAHELAVAFIATASLFASIGYVLGRIDRCARGQSASIPAPTSASITMAGQSP